MNTTFILHLADCSEYTARSAARQFFEELDRLEDLLSRYRESSDVSRINAMQSGETLYISEACHRCLTIAAEMQALTGGLFDVTLGAGIRHYKDAQPGDAPGPRGRVVIDPDQHAVVCLEPGREIDLGGIGKGFALDWLSPIFEEWQISSALLAAGNSTLLARGTRAWPVDLPKVDDPFPLRNQALSVSGTTMQGAHILDPRTGQPARTEFQRLWITAPSAAQADALSTAALLMSAEQVKELPAHFPEAAVIHSQ